MFSAANYIKVKSLEEAWQLNQKRSNKIIGGMLWMKMGKGRIQTAIDLSGLELDRIEETDEYFKIGCMATLRMIETHPELNRYTSGAVREAVKNIVGVQFRNLATVGGSIFGRYGFSDVLTVLMAADSSVELYKRGIIPLREFAEMKYDNDILVSVIVRKTPARFSYMSVRNSKTDFPVLTCAAARYENELILSVGARPSRAKAVSVSEELANKMMNEDTAAEIGRYAASQLSFGSNLRASGAYRRHLTEVLVKRACMKLAENGEEEKSCL